MSYPSPKLLIPLNNFAEFQVYILDYLPYPCSIQSYFWHKIFINWFSNFMTNLGLNIFSKKIISLSIDNLHVQLRRKRVLFLVSRLTHQIYCECKLISASYAKKINYSPTLVVRWQKN